MEKRNVGSGFVAARAIGIILGITLSPSVGFSQDALATEQPLVSVTETSTSADMGAESETLAATAQELADMPLSGDYASDVERRWKDFLQSKGRNEGQNPGNIFIVSSTAVVNFDAGRPGWIEARRNAFQLAELRAKAAMIRFLGQDIVRRRVLTLMENPRFGQGYAEDIAVLTQADRIIQKASDAGEAALDGMLKQLDPDYDPEKYAEMERQAKELRLEEAFREKVTSMASRLVSGALVYNVIEGQTASGGSEILVGLLWSPNMGRLAIEIGDSVYTMPTLPAGRSVKDELPQTVGQAVGSFGTRVFINENGERVLIAYGQAEPVKVSAEQRDRALRAALDRAERNASAEIASFVGERLTSRSETESRALSQVYEGLAQSGSKIEISNVETVQAVTRRVTLTGVEPVFRQVVAHPQTGQDVAIAAVMWSPQGLGAAKAMGEALKNTATGTEPNSTELRQKGGSGKVILEGQPSNEDAL